jgi:phosphatidyl-myo-inositol dimannoside synthase
MNDSRNSAVMLAYDFCPAEGGIQTLMRNIVTAEAGISWHVLTRTTLKDKPDDTKLRVKRAAIRPEMRLIDRIWAKTLRRPFTVAELVAFQTGKKLLALSRGVKPDFLFADQYWSALSVKQVAQKVGCPWGLGVYGKDLLGVAPEREKLLRAADFVLACSSFSKNLAIEKGTREEKTFVVHPTVDTAVFAPAEDRDTDKTRLGLEGRRILLTVAHLVPRKGHELVIQALPAICAQCPDVTYLIVGRGAHEGHLRSLTQELGLANSVRFCGYVSSDELPGYYRAADIYVMPSMNEGDVEGFGISFIEAAACSTPSIGSRSGGIPDAISDGVTGYLVEPSDVAGVANRIMCLLSDERLRCKMGDSARANAVANFSPAMFSQSLITVFQQLLAHEPGNG